LRRRFDGIAPPENAEAITPDPQRWGAPLRGSHGFFVQDAAALPEILAFLTTD
jgi:hypothetical protein